MSAAADKARAQALVVAALRLPVPGGAARWTPALIARAQDLTTAEATAAIQSLRFAGKIEFTRLALMPSLMIDAPALQRADLHTNGEASANPGTQASTARTEAAAVTAGETATEGEGDGPCCAAPSPEAFQEPVALIQATAGEEAVAMPPVAASSPGSVRTDATHGHSLRPAQAAALLADIEAYIARVDMPYNEFGNLALGFGGFVGLLRKRGSARSVAAERAYAFMAAWPDGATREQVGIVPRIAPQPKPRAPAPDQSPLVAAVAAEAFEAGARRQVARATGHTQTISATSFAVQAACLEESEDGFAFLRRKWPDLLGRVIVAAHDAGIGPGPMLARIIEQGLLRVEDDAREEAA